MKKILLTILALGLALGLGACDGESAADPTPAAPSTGVSATPAPSGGETEEAFAFPVAAAEDYVLRVDQDMAQALEALGEPKSYFEAASCAFDGLDKTYTYSGFTVTTRPEEAGDFVNSILLTDDSVTTAEGVYIGCTAQEVTAAYGEQELTGNVLSYTRGGVTLNFVLQEDKVASIEYFPG